MTEMPSETAVRAWARLTLAQQTVQGKIETALKQAGFPPLAWYDVLLEVERAGKAGIRPFALERAMLLEQYNLSRLLDRIVRAGYIERRPCPEDGRGHVILITKCGAAMRRKMWPVYARAIEQAVGSRLDPQDAEALGGLLGRLLP